MTVPFRWDSPTAKDTSDDLCRVLEQCGRRTLTWWHVEVPPERLAIGASSTCPWHGTTGRNTAMAHHESDASALLDALTDRPDFDVAWEIVARLYQALADAAIERRTRVAGIFPHDETALRPITADRVEEVQALSDTTPRFGIEE